METWVVNSGDVRRLNEERLAYVIFMCNSLLRLADVQSTWKLIYMATMAPGVAQVEMRFRCDFPYRYEGAPNTPSRKTVRVMVDVID